MLSFKLFGLVKGIGLVYGALTGFRQNVPYLILGLWAASSAPCKHRIFDH